MCKKRFSLSLEGKVCDACRKKFSKVSTAETESVDLFESSEDVAASSPPDDETFHQLESQESINQRLSAIGETPVVKKKTPTYQVPKRKNEEDHDSCEEYIST